MAYEKKDMEGVLFKNTDRKTDKHPNAQGTALIDGVEYWVSAWTKEGSKGKFQSLAFKRKEARAQEIRNQPSREERDSYGNRDLDDGDLPF
jgi:hypothetical protein